MSGQKWPQNLWQNLNTVGGSGGNPFEIVGQTESNVTKLRIYKNPSGKTSLQGIHVTFSDGQEGTAGKTSGPSQDHIFESGEKITAMTLWGDGVGSRTGRIQFTTNKKKNFDFGQNTDGQSSFPTEVGSGFLIGFVGNAGDEIDFMGAVFLKQSKKAFVDDIKYPDLDFTGDQGLTLKTLQTINAQWNGKPYVFRFTGSETETTTTTWNSKFTIEFGVEVSVKAGVPLIVEGELKVSLKLGGQFDWGGSNSKAVGLQWNTEHKIDTPDDAVKCTAACYQGKMDIKYTGTYHLVMDDDQTFAFPTEGTLEQVVFSEVNVSVEQLGGPNAGKVSNFAASGAGQEKGLVEGSAQEGKVLGQGRENNGEEPKLTDGIDDGTVEEEQDDDANNQTLDSQDEQDQDALENDEEALPEEEAGEAEEEEADEVEEEEEDAGEVEGEDAGEEQEEEEEEDAGGEEEEEEEEDAGGEEEEEEEEDAGEEEGEDAGEDEAEDVGEDEEEEVGEVEGEEAGEFEEDGADVEDHEETGL
jgi:Jacalin-like lectin domain